MLAWKNAAPKLMQATRPLDRTVVRSVAGGRAGASPGTTSPVPLHRRLAPRSRVLLLAFTVGLLWSVQPSRARAEAAPSFGVRTAYAQLVEGVYLLNARLQLPLNERVRSALNEGVPLTVVLELEVSRARRYWVDETVASLRQEYQLQDQAVSERYVVRNLNSGELSSYPDLDAALEQLARVSGLPVLDEALIRPGYRHEFSLRVTLNLGDMPDTLRVLMFWTDDYHHVSEWYTWPLLQ